MKPRYRITHGLRMPLGFPRAALESALHYVPEAGDIFVASYPKSGTTWLQYIVYMLVRGRVIEADQTLTGLFPHLEESGVESVAGLPRPRLIKTHLGLELAPWSAAARYLVIIRNPFDCVVSFYHHTRGFPRHYDFATGGFDEFFECFLGGEVDFGDYFDHLISWHGAVGRENVFLLTYESLRQAPGQAIRRIAGFLGNDVDAPGFDQWLETVVAETSLSSMRRNQRRWSSQRLDSAPPFVREGRVGGWRGALAPGQAGALLARFRRRLDDAGVADPWPDVTNAVSAYVKTGRA